jgi:predicted transcriptional regulator of viral defense system
MSVVLGLGKESRARLAKLLRETKGTISVEEAAASFGMSPKRTADTLAWWERRGWLSRVRRGLYVPVPLESSTGDVALEDPWLVAARLFAPCYIGGWSAAEHWNLTEQIFRSVMVCTAGKPHDRKPQIKGTPFVLRTVAREAMFGMKSVWRGRVKVDVSDPTRTVLDLLDDPGLGGGIRHAVDVLRSYLGSEAKDLRLMVAYADRLGNGAVFKRLGFLLERLDPAEKETVAACRERLTKGNAKLDPALPAQRLVTAWRLWVPEGWTVEAKHD